jgi:transmembrane sensor
MRIHTPITTADHDVPEDLADEAMAWVLRLTSGEADARDQADFVAWRSQSPLHARALADARELWTDLGPALVVDQERRLAQALVAERGAAANDAAEVGQRWAMEASGRPLTFPTGPSRPLDLPVWARVAAAAVVAVAAVGFTLLQHPFADLHTGGGQRQIASLADGTRVELAPNSTLDVAIGPSGERQVTLTRGEAMFDVAHDPSRPFIVRSGEGQVRVLGTAFSVRRTGGMTRVTVTRGRVEVTSGQAQRILTPDRTVVYGLTSLGGVQAIDARAATGWTRNRLIFENRSLGDVIAEIDRFEPQKVVLLNRQASDKRVNAVVDLTRTDQWLQALEQSEKVTITRLPGVILIR